MSVTKIREKLLQAISGLEDGSMTKENAMTISALSQTYMNTIKVEIEARKVLGEKFTISDLIQPVEIQQLPTKNEMNIPDLKPGQQVRTANGVFAVVEVDFGQLTFKAKSSHGTNEVTWYVFEDILEVIND